MDKMVKFLKEQYPPGTRIELREMKDPYNPVPPGTKGTVSAVDDAGIIQVEWDNGRGLGLIPGEDSFKILPPELTKMKLYMPLTGDIFEDVKDWSEDPYAIEGSELKEYRNQIAQALEDNCLPEESERGIMHWYHEQDSVNEKVQSVEFDVEYREGELWGVAKCEILGKLDPEEMQRLKEYIRGQAGDGWGEGFEQRDIQVDVGVLNVHLWNSDMWSLKTEEEQFGNLRQEEGMNIEPSF